MKKIRLPTGEVVERDRDEDLNAAMRLLEEQERIHAEQTAIAQQTLSDHQGA